MSPRAAAGVARWWTRLYTAGLPVDLRDARRAEVESDLWESVADGAPSRHILARVALGLADDLTWSLTGTDGNRSDKGNEKASRHFDYRCECRSEAPGRAILTRLRAGCRCKASWLAFKTRAQAA